MNGKSDDKIEFAGVESFVQRLKMLSLKSSEKILQLSAENQKLRFERINIQL